MAVTKNFYERMFLEGFVELRNMEISFTENLKLAYEVIKEFPKKNM